MVYSVGGTGATLFLGCKLVGLNFQQEAQEANFRCASKAITHKEKNKYEVCWLTLQAEGGMPTSCTSFYCLLRFTSLSVCTAMLAWGPAW